MASVHYTKPVYLCSVQGVKLGAIKAHLLKLCPSLNILELPLEEVTKSGFIDNWNEEVVIADDKVASKLVFSSKKHFAFIQVSTLIRHSTLMVDWTSCTYIMQGTWAGIDATVESVKAASILPEVDYCRLAHPKFSQLMAEYFIGQVICSERKFHENRRAQLASTWANTKAGDYEYKYGFCVKRTTLYSVFTCSASAGQQLMRIVVVVVVVLVVVGTKLNYLRRLWCS